MVDEGMPKIEECNCLAFRQAARNVSQFYDQFLAPMGLRTSQFSILAKVRRLGPITINALAESMVMDRTTLGRNILPLERDGLIEVVQSKEDRRRKELQLTDAGLKRLREAAKSWRDAQAQFEAMIGAAHAVNLRTQLHDVAKRDLAKA